MVHREGGSRAEEDHEEEVGAPGIGKSIIVLRTLIEHSKMLEANLR